MGRRTMNTRHHRRGIGEKHFSDHPRWHDIR
jgi:hypothetical protein